MTNTHATARTTRWDIFCTVIDNYGDIGVTWRLAKQLSAQYQIAVTLWVDDLQSFSHILPTLDPNASTQMQHNVRINLWSTPFCHRITPTDVIIEAFACELPNVVIEAMLAQQQSQHAPVWLNLEYLSAEQWVEGCHGLPSLQNNGLKKYFYFPGFTAKTGGLICEHDTLALRKKWQADPKHRRQLFSQLGINGIADDHEVISVFSYENSGLLALCQQWMKADKPVHVLLPKGRSLHSLTSLLPCSIEQLHHGQSIQHQQLTLHILPMSDQQGYDQLLWSCDLNIVRGEDSFLRAQWAGKPFIWHIYPQEDDYHLIKLDAFLSQYSGELDQKTTQWYQQLSQAFNQENIPALLQAWQQRPEHQLKLAKNAQQWPKKALNDADLASRLVQFVKNS